MDSNALITIKVQCPICHQEVPVTRVRAASYRVTAKDSDFGVRYEGTNPLLYEVYVCEVCGYAAMADRFDDVSETDRKIILSQVAAKWKKKSFEGERSITMALDADKLALYILQIRKAKSSEFAKLCMRIAWLYRLKSDPKEIDYLSFALQSYQDTYEHERFPVEKMDEGLCMYMIAELNRRVGHTDTAAQWFSKLFTNPAARRNRELLDLARDQYQLVKTGSKQTQEE